MDLHNVIIRNRAIDFEAVEMTEELRRAAEAALPAARDAAKAARAHEEFTFQFSSGERTWRDMDGPKAAVLADAARDRVAILLLLSQGQNYSAMTGYIDNAAARRALRVPA